jgi:hypothetical protein
MLAVGAVEQFGLAPPAPLRSRGSRRALMLAMEATERQALVLQAIPRGR